MKSAEGFYLAWAIVCIIVMAIGLLWTDEIRRGCDAGAMAQCEGTIARMLMHLLGSNIYCGPSLGQLSNRFGTAGLIGKKIAMVHGSITAQFAPLSQRSS